MYGWQCNHFHSTISILLSYYSNLCLVCTQPKKHKIAKAKISFFSFNIVKLWNWSVIEESRLDSVTFSCHFTIIIKGFLKKTSGARISENVFLERIISTKILWIKTVNLIIVADKTSVIFKLWLLYFEQNMA